MQEETSSLVTPPTDSPLARPEANLDQSVVIQKLGLTGLDPAQQEDFMVQLAELIQMRVASRVSDYLTEEQLTELDKLVEADKEDEAAEYIDQHVTTYGAMVQEEINRSLGELSDDASEIKRLVEEAVAERPTDTTPPAAR